MAKALEVEIFVRRDGELLPYGALAEEEKRRLARSLNERAIRAVAGLRGCEVEFLEGTEKDG